MKKILYALILLATACTAPQPDAVVLSGIPKEAPSLHNAARFDANDFKHSVDVRYNGDTVIVVSDLPEGITYRAYGADIVMNSSVEGVEYILSGGMNKGSFSLLSQKPALLSLSSIAIKSQKRNAVTLSAPLVYVRAVGESPSYIIDGVPADTVYVHKNAAALRIEGDAVICGGNIAVRGERSSAVHCSGHLLFNGGNFSVEASRKDAVVADSAIFVADGNIRVIATADAFKSKKGCVTVAGGNLLLLSNGSKGDGIQARNVYLFGGNVQATVAGDAARGINSKAAVYLVDGILSVESNGNAIFSEKKADYTSGACIKSETHLYIGNATVSLRNNGDGGKGVNCNGIMQMDGGVLLVENYGNDVQHHEDREAHTSAKGVKCDSAVVINGGIIDIRAYGSGERCEGLESKRTMTIAGENTSVYIFANDDAINAGGRFTVKGGRIYAYSACNDGIDCNEGIDIQGGFVVANGCPTPEQGIDVDNPALFSVKGGTYITMGGTFGPSPTMPMGKATVQPALGWKSTSLQRGKYAVIADKEKPLVAYCLPRTLADGAICFTSPNVKEGSEYAMLVIDAISGGEYIGNGVYLSPDAVEMSAAEWKKAEINVADENEFGGFPFPPGGMKPDGNFPAPPPGMKFDGNFPPPPGMKFDGNFPPPPPGGMNFEGGFPPPPPVHKDTEGYGAGNLPGGGWLLR